MAPKQANNKKQSLPFVSPFLNPGFQRPQEDLDMDWSMDPPQAPASPTLRVTPASKHVPLPHVPLHNKGPNGKNRAASTAPSVLSYGEGQPAISGNWDGSHHALSIFGSEDTLVKDSKMIYDSLTRMRSFIKHHLNPMEREVKPIVKKLWKLIDTIYSANWDTVPFCKDKNLTIRKCVGDQIMPYYTQNQPLTKSSNTTTSNILSPLQKAEVAPPSTINIPRAPPPPNKNVESTAKKDPKPSNLKKSYVQASKSNLLHIEDIVQVKEAFPALSADEVGKVLKIKNSGGNNRKPKINMTTRGPSRKEVIIPMAKHITELIVNSAHNHITNINKCLRNSKSDIVTDFIQSTNNGIIITTSKPANDLNLTTIENYLKNMQNVDSNSIESPHLPKSKSYMKIIGLPYKINQDVISPDFIEGVLKETHLFKGVVLASKPCVIKASPKSDMAVV